MATIPPARCSSAWRCGRHRRSPSWATPAWRGASCSWPAAPWSPPACSSASRWSCGNASRSAPSSSTRHPRPPHRSGERALLEDTVAAAGADAALLFIDHDGFKPINDRFGHSAGDRVLVEIARRCAAAVRPADLVARLGGDEFAVLARTGADAALTDLADRLLEAIRSPIDLDGQPVRVSATIGIAEATTARERASSGSCELLAAADLAMYEAKRAGGDRWSAARAPSLTR